MGDEPSTRANTNARESLRKRRNLAWIKRPAFVRNIREAFDVEAPAVYVCGDEVPTMGELGELAAAGWQVAADGATPTLRRPGKVVRWILPWTGRACDPEVAGSWWDEMTTVLGIVAAGGRPFGSPGTTGRDVWLRTLPADKGWPILSAETQEFIRSIAGQGRMQMMPPPDRSSECTIPALYEYDSRLAYLGCLTSLPVGEPQRLTTSTAVWTFLREMPFGQAFINCTWHAPADWQHPGILPARTDHGPAWPADGAGWVHASSFQLAREWGWEVTPVEAIAWIRSGDPFRGFRKAIDAGLAWPASAPADVWRSAWRAMALHTIGAMYAAPRKVTHFLSEFDADLVPEDAQDVVRVRGAGDARFVRYSRTEQALWPETHHPEWSATIWARARNRLLDVAGPPDEAGERTRCGALHLRADAVVAFRTDAIYTTEPTGWRDDSKIGRYRLKRASMGPFAWPATQGELLGLLEADAETMAQVAS